MSDAIFTRNLINHTKEISTILQETSLQIASRNKARKFEGMPSIVVPFENLRGTMVENEAYILKGKLMLPRVVTTNNAIKQLQTVAKTLRDTILHSKNSQEAQTRDFLQKEGKSALREALNALNESFEGKKLFFGSLKDPEDITEANLPSVDTYALDDTDYIDEITGAVPSWYKGDLERTLEKTSKNTDVETRLTANQRGFQDLIKACNIIANTPTNHADYEKRIEEAMRVATNAKSWFDNNAAYIDRTIARLKTSAETLQAAQAEATGQRQSLNGADFAESVSRFQTLNESQRIIYDILGRSSQLSLMHYMRD